MVSGRPLVNIFLLAVLSGAVPEASPPQRHNVSGASLDAVYRGWSEKATYPFTGLYSCRSDGQVGKVKVEDTPARSITFYRKSNDSLPKPSYGCGYTAYWDNPVWRFNLQDACKALIKDSGGYYDQRLLFGVFAEVQRGLLGVPYTFYDQECFIIA
ncbi:hypothetical protein FOZ62_014493 [Perkinsus olseni]|uniref:Uncharacterized protein n=1 Tax=Perkinsus olseni TaxID=32597 RepID=A0A7J6U0E0_PEROL|nr:hypothetical protein FOZ62_014493 [Perkinsus olseni]